ncbi:hypothetical protein FJTKL_04095 [Diaporthe vaccinii]|uniref:Uncharacterized protein n=1 Tax=Diaporthe vaccinii TaxID=105482 RepID=A0ABR4DTT0_9PEZI
MRCSRNNQPADQLCIEKNKSVGTFARCISVPGEIKPFVPCHPTQKKRKNVGKARYDATRRLIGGIIGRRMVLDKLSFPRSRSKEHFPYQASDSCFVSRHRWLDSNKKDHQPSGCRRYAKIDRPDSQPSAGDRRSLESTEIDVDLHGARDLATDAVSISIDSPVGVDEAGATGGDGGAEGVGGVLGADLHAGDGQAGSLGDNGRSIVTRPAVVALVLKVPLGPGAGNGAVGSLLDVGLAGALEAGTATLGVLVEGDVLLGASRQRESGGLESEEAVDTTISADLVPDEAVHVRAATKELGGVVVLRGKVGVGQQDLVAAVVSAGAGVASVLDLVEGGTLGLGCAAEVGEAGELGDALAGGGGVGARGGLGGRGGRGGGRGGGGRGGGWGRGGDSGDVHVGDGVGIGLVGDDGGGGSGAVVLSLDPGDRNTVDDSVDDVPDGALLVLGALLVVEAGVARRVGGGTDGAEQEEGCKTSHCDD